MFAKKRFHIILNSPVVLSFTALCLFATVLGILTNHYTTRLLFSVYRSSLANPLTYFRFIGHVFGHSGWNHFTSNILYILLLGPMLEEKYGSRAFLVVLLIAALSTGLVNFIFFPHVMLEGASGIVFALILLSSITEIEGGGIPLTFVLIAAIYMGQQLYNALFTVDNISQLSHIIGGISGAVMGFTLKVPARRGY